MKRYLLLIPILIGCGPDDPSPKLKELAKHTIENEESFITAHNKLEDRVRQLEKVLDIKPPTSKTPENK